MFCKIDGMDRGYWHVTNDGIDNCLRGVRVGEDLVVANVLLHDRRDEYTWLTPHGVWRLSSFDGNHPAEGCPYGQR